MTTKLQPPHVDNRIAIEEMFVDNSKSVSARALVERINRKLEETGERLSHGKNPWGGGPDVWRIKDVTRNVWVAAPIDLEKLGREVGVLAADEFLESPAAAIEGA